jgi:hypothetical protein
MRPAQGWSRCAGLFICPESPSFTITFFDKKIIYSNQSEIRPLSDYFPLLTMPFFTISTQDLASLVIREKGHEYWLHGEKGCGGGSFRKASGP